MNVLLLHDFHSVEHYYLVDSNLPVNHLRQHRPFQSSMDLMHLGNTNQSLNLQDAHQYQPSLREIPRYQFQLDCNYFENDSLVLTV